MVKEFVLSAKKESNYMRHVPTYDIHDLIEFLVKNPNQVFDYSISRRDVPCLMLAFFRSEDEKAISVDFFGTCAYDYSGRLIVAKFKFPHEFILSNIHVVCKTSQEILEKISYYGWL